MDLRTSGSLDETQDCSHLIPCEEKAERYSPSQVNPNKILTSLGYVAEEIQGHLLDPIVRYRDAPEDWEYPVVLAEVVDGSRYG